MSSKWRIIDFIEYEGTILSIRGGLQVGDERIALHDVATILIGESAHYSGSVVARAAEYGVPIITCNWRQQPVACTLPWSDNTKVGARHRAQAALTLPRQKNAWMQIVKSKLRGQASNLAYLSSTDAAEKVWHLSKEVRSGDPNNLEARGARTYWANLFPGEKFSRSPGSGAGRNALLDYGYSVLRGLTVRSICAAGLWPSLGVWHRNRSNVFALADDLVEVFRPAVDYAAIQIREVPETLSREMKHHIVAVAAEPFGVEGVSVETAITMLAQDFAHYVEGRGQKFEVKPWCVTSG